MANPLAGQTGGQSPFPIGGSAPNLSQIQDTLQHIVEAINGIGHTLSSSFPVPVTSSASISTLSISTLSQTSINISCSGAALGMWAQASFSANLNGLTVSAYVPSANSIEVIMFNGSATTISISTGTISVWARST